jgi:hypothetical protein
LVVKLSGALPLFAALGLAAALAAPAFAAGVIPPLPRPRPDHNAQPEPPPTQPGQESDRQKLIRTGFPGGEDSDALMPPPTDAVDATKLGTTPQPVTLVAEVTEKGAKINGGLVWRVFNSTPDKNGQLPMIAKSEQPTPTLSLKPGDYVVHVAYGQAQASDTLSVGNKAGSKSMILDAGGLKLNALIAGDIQIPVSLLHFDVFTAGATDADRTLVAGKIGPNDILTLNAGTYHIVSYFGGQNATVRADLRVEPGQLTDATLYQKAAQISFKLVSDAGGEAIADIDWALKNSDGLTIFTNTGTFPATVLEEGTYTITAKRGDKVYSRTFRVKPGQTQDIEVLTTAS